MTLPENQGAKVEHENSENLEKKMKTFLSIGSHLKTFSSVLGSTVVSNQAFTTALLRERDFVLTLKLHVIIVISVQRKCHYIQV